MFLPECLRGRVAVLARKSYKYSKKYVTRVSFFCDDSNQFILNDLNCLEITRKTGVSPVFLVYKAFISFRPLHCT